MLWLFPYSRLPQRVRIVTGSNPFRRIEDSRKLHRLVNLKSMLHAMKPTWCWQLRRACPAYRSMSTKSLSLEKRTWQVSSYGRCCNSRSTIGIGSLHPSGYRTINIAKQKYYVHRVVKLTFHGLPADEIAWQVHHRDGIKENNRLDNLEFVSKSVNALHSVSDPARGCGASKRLKPVFWRPVGSEHWTPFGSVSEAAQHLRCYRSTVSRLCRGSKPSAKHGEFRYQDVMEPALEGEEWRIMRHPITGAEIRGRMVSSLGRVTLQNGFTYRGCQTCCGYYVTGIVDSTGSSKQLIHRLVATAFLGQAPSADRVLVNHKDGNKVNNAVENLEWVTHAENVSHYFSLAGVKGRQRNSIARPVWSRSCGSKGEWKWHASMTQAASSLGLHSGNISACTRGVAKQTGGYEFRLAEVPDAKPLPGEEWRPIDLSQLMRDREIRTRAASR